MLSIGIIWNSAQKYEKEIIGDLSNMVKVIDYFNYDFGDNFLSFVQSLYESESMEQWKIDKKLSHMLLSSNRNVTIIFFEFDERDIFYHSMKQKNVFSQLEICKSNIRKKYSDLIPNYTFDIVFHATDDVFELKKCYDVLCHYLYKSDEEKGLRRIKIKV